MVRHVQKAQSYSVDHSGGMNVLESTQHLVDKKANMVVAQALTLDDLVQVGAHQRIDEVHLGEALQRRRRRKHVQQSDYLLVAVEKVLVFACVHNFTVCCHTTTPSTTGPLTLSWRICFRSLISR